MKISSDPQNPSYHACVSYIKDVYLDGQKMLYCVTIDSCLGTIVQHKTKADENGRIVFEQDKDRNILTTLLEGEVAVTWRNGSSDGAQEHNMCVEQLIRQCEATHGPR